MLDPDPIRAEVDAVLAILLETVERNEAAARHYRRIAIIDYASFLRHAHLRSPELNRTALATVCMYAQKAIRRGADEDAILATFAQLRAYWLPRVAAGKIDDEAEWKPKVTAI